MTKHTTFSYKKAGVDIHAGDRASSNAGRIAATTFPGRARAKLGKPVRLPGGFAGALDMGDYYLVTCDDGTGTKMAVAELMKRFDTIGADLVAMVADDAACLGAEVMTVSNTIDCPKVDEKKIAALLSGLAASCIAQRIAIPGGEIAEVGETVTSLVWNATAIGVVEKKKLIDGSKIRPGDTVITLFEPGLRSNGYTLARAILKNAYGAAWHTKKFQGKTWGAHLLTPSTIYHRALLALHGAYGETPKVALHGVVHITGGGIPGNLPRIFRDTRLGAHLPTLFPPAPFVAELIRLGSVPLAEARRSWCLNNGMLLILPPKEASKALSLLKKNGITAQIAGSITNDSQIRYD